MSFEFNPADEDEHGECRHEIEQLNALIVELKDVLSSARAICQRRGADTAWERFDERIASFGVGAVTAKVFKVLPSDLELGNDE